MIKRPLLKFCFLLLAACLSLFVKAQRPARSDSAAVAKKRVQIITSDSLISETKDTLSLESLIGHVIVKQEKTLFYCDSAVINRNQNILEAFGHVHINDADSVHTYSDYLRYVGNEKKAYLRGNVKLTDGKGTLTAPELEYTTTTKIGIYTKGGKLVNNQTVLTSKEGYYYGETRDAVFKKEVRLKDPEYSIETDTLLYNTYSEIATFTVPTKITGKDNSRVNTSNGFYESKSKKVYFGKRPDIQMDKTTFLIADEVANDSSGYGEARGHAIYRDTAQGVSIVADNIKTNRSNKSFLATLHPILIIKQEEGDSLYIASDTLYSSKLSELRKSRVVPDIRDYGLRKDFAPVLTDSASTEIADTTTNITPEDSSIRAQVKTSDSLKSSVVKSELKKDSADKPVTRISASLKPDTANAKVPIVKSTSTDTAKRKITFIKDTASNKEDSTDRFFEAYFHVRIYSDSLQAVCDSLFYSGEDSAFRLFRNPIVWTKTNQITGDTIYMYTQTKKPKRMYVFENGLAINKVGDDFYNQLKGRTINGYFKDGEIDFLRAKGPGAESVYYAQDENNKFVGVNKATADIIDSYFKNRKPERVVMRVGLKGTSYPMRQVNHTDMRLRGFKWIEDIRPKSKNDLFRKDTSAVPVKETKEKDTSEEKEKTD